MNIPAGNSNAALIVVLVLSVIGMIAVRLIKSRKPVIAGFKMEIIYLCIYAFLGGNLFMYFLTTSPASDWLWGIALLSVFSGGFVLRLISLFKQMGRD